NPAHDLLIHRDRFVRRPGCSASGNEISLQDLGRDVRDREVRHGAAEMAVGVAVLKTADEKRVEGGSGDDTQLTAHRYGPGKDPIGDADTHAALDDDRMRDRNTHFACRLEKT